jgi:hypothetical protein
MNCPAWARTRNNRSKVCGDADFTTGQRHFLFLNRDTNRDLPKLSNAQPIVSKAVAPTSDGGSKDLPYAERSKMLLSAGPSSLGGSRRFWAFNRDIIWDVS